MSPPAGLGPDPLPLMLLTERNRNVLRKTVLQPSLQLLSERCDCHADLRLSSVLK